jgi:exosome complex component CSL4
MPMISVPGEELGVEEEYVPGDFTDLDGNGAIVSTVIGVPNYDVKAHEVKVNPIKPRLLQQGSIVYGRVVSSTDKVAVVRIVAVLDKGKINRINATGFIYIVHAGDNRLNTVYDAVGIGDVIKARVISHGPPYHLSIRGLGLGVVEARCPHCRAILKFKGTRAYCPNCGVSVRKKVALE